MSSDIAFIPRREAEHCITCSDEGVPMRVVATDDDRALARCQAAEGRTTSVDVTLVAPVEVGDSLLVHAGVALVRLDTAELNP